MSPCTKNNDLNFLARVNNGEYISQGTYPLASSFLIPTRLVNKGKRTLYVSSITPVSYCYIMLITKHIICR